MIHASTPAPVKINTVSMEAWRTDQEEVDSWLQKAEDHLVSLNNLGQKHLDTAKRRFYEHEDFMIDLKSHQDSIKEV